MELVLLKNPKSLTKSDIELQLVEPKISVMPTCQIEHLSACVKLEKFRTWMLAPESEKRLRKTLARRANEL
jgi:hypothetical protein